MFQPVVAGSGLQGWRMLQRTLPTQKMLFADSAVQKRMIDHYRANAVGLKSSGSLVEDRQLREVALTAFGLQDDLNSQFFVKRILDDGVQQPSALANRLADTRYRQMAESFGFDGVSQLVGLTRAQTERVVSQFQDQSFELALGGFEPGFRLALNTEREVTRLAEQDVSADARWFLVMGNPPVRQVFESALGLPSSIGRLDIDQQLGIFRDFAQSKIGVGEIHEIAQEPRLGKFIDQFILKQQIQQGVGISSSSIALQLLRN